MNPTKEESIQDFRPARRETTHSLCKSGATTKTNRLAANRGRPSSFSIHNDGQMKMPGAYYVKGRASGQFPAWADQPRQQRRTQSERTLVASISPSPILRGQLERTFEEYSSHSHVLNVTVEAIGSQNIQRAIPLQGQGDLVSHFPNGRGRDERKAPPIPTHRIVECDREIDEDIRLEDCTLSSSINSQNGTSRSEPSATNESVVHVPSIARIHPDPDNIRGTSRHSFQDPRIREIFDIFPNASINRVNELLLVHQFEPAVMILADECTASQEVVAMPRLRRTVYKDQFLDQIKDIFHQDKIQNIVDLQKLAEDNDIALLDMDSSSGIPTYSQIL